MGYDYRDKVIVITGGAGGIGSHLARDFSAKGAILVLLDISKAKLDAVINSLSGQMHRAIALDLTDRSAISQAISEIETSFSSLNTLLKFLLT